MQVLLHVIVSWLSITFGLPASYEHPRVEFASAAKMAEVRRIRLAELNEAGSEGVVTYSNPLNYDNNVHAMYDDSSKTIYLSNNWDGTSPTDISILVHEMVHHLQNVAQLTFKCREDREKTAYAAQERWLGLFKRRFDKELKLDRLTVLLRTKCMF